MGKFALFSLNMIFLVAYKFFFGGEVEVTQVFPENVEAGASFDVEIVINKSDHEGFAKWQQSLPEGFVASSIESEGATFSFKNNTVKLIWMALPDKERFSIKYNIVTDKKLAGSFDINGKFSFIEDNERRDVEAATHIINIMTAEQLAQLEAMNAKLDSIAENDAAMAENEEEESEEVAEVEVAAPVIAAAAIPIVLDTAEKKEAEPMADMTGQSEHMVTVTKKVKVQRRIKFVSPGKYIVELNIDKDGFRSFGKIEEYIPPGYTASELESGSGRFSMEDNVLKILWMAMPESSEILVKYNMESLGDELDSATVHGVFSFLRGDESVQLSMAGTRFPNTYEASQEMAAKEESPKEVETQEVVAVPVVSKKEELEAQVADIPAPQASVQYRVQIAAAKREVGQPYFIGRHGIQDKVTIDFHSTWFKYMIGSFSVYKEARDRRNQIWADNNKIDDAFVTAYSADERISVQEALMITQQKWYK